MKIRIDNPFVLAAFGFVAAGATIGASQGGALAGARSGHDGFAASDRGAAGSDAGGARLVAPGTR